MILFHPQVSLHNLLASTMTIWRDEWSSKNVLARLTAMTPLATTTRSTLSGDGERIDANRWGCLPVLVRSGPRRKRYKREISTNEEKQGYLDL